MMILVNLLIGSAIYTLLGLLWAAILLAAVAPFALAIAVRQVRGGAHARGRHAYQAR
jgi:hypothetical protein